MAKQDVLTLSINEKDIPFEKCVVNSSDAAPGTSGEPHNGIITIFFKNPAASAVVVPYKRKPISLKYSTESQTVECAAVAHDTIRFDGRAAFYLLF